MIVEDAVYLDPNRKLAQSHKLAVNLIQKKFTPEMDIAVLDIGVGSGAVAKGLREIFPKLMIDGVDKSDVYLDTSKAYYNNVYYVPIEELEIERQYDVILLLDVLEHLEDPWQALLSLKRKYLKKSGFVVISIPNIAHWTIRLKLLRGYFKYARWGILDKTHLRFFTLGTYRELLQSSELHPVDMDYSYSMGISEYKEFPFSLIPQEFRNKILKKLVNWKPSIFAIQFISISHPDVTVSEAISKAEN